MRLHLDNIIFSLQQFGGASVYWSNILERAHASDDIDLIEANSRKWQRLLPVYSNSDVFHSSHFRNAISPKGTKIVTTVHDLNYELGLMQNNINSKLNIYQRRRSVEMADAIICISNSTKVALQEYYGNILDGKVIEVIHHGFVPPTMPSRSQAVIKHKPYIIFVGGRNGYKNFKRFLVAYSYSKLPKLGINVLCTGQVFNLAENQLISDLKISNLVYQQRFDSSQDLDYLYKEALFFVYPSLMEGFGLPVLEAFANGCPVACSENTSLSEVAGLGNAITFDPRSTESIVHSLECLLDEELRKKLMVRGLNRLKHFSWEISFDAHKNVYKLLL
jgi:glycosyltransferase involved in cell wall biosynthesis